MHNGWTRGALMQRIDRCYMVAAGTKALDKRQHYIALARGYRLLLASMPERPLAFAEA